jgi:Rrf2 family protein
MKLSRTVGYALQATLQLARADGDAPVPCSRLAAEGKMPERFLLQILRNLVAHGILASTRGVDGGYTLDRAPEDVSLLQIIEAVDGPVNAAMPPTDGFPLDTRVRLERSLEAATDLARRELAAVKIADLLLPSP